MKHTLVLSLFASFIFSNHNTSAEEATYQLRSTKGESFEVSSSEAHGLAKQLSKTERVWLMNDNGSESLIEPRIRYAGEEAYISNIVWDSSNSEYIDGCQYLCEFFGKEECENLEAHPSFPESHKNSIYRVGLKTNGEVFAFSRISYEDRIAYRGPVWLVKSLTCR